MKSITFCITLLFAFANAKKKGKYAFLDVESECWSMVARNITCCDKGVKANYFDEYGDWYKKDLNSDVIDCGVVDGYCWTIVDYLKRGSNPCCSEEQEKNLKPYRDFHGEWRYLDEDKGDKCAVRHTRRPWNDREEIEETKEEWNVFKEQWKKNRINFERMSVFVGDDESKINFSWYSRDQYTPMIRISKNKDMSDAQIFEGKSEIQIEKMEATKENNNNDNIDDLEDEDDNEEVIDGDTKYKIDKKFKIARKKYYTNRVTVKNIERNSIYYYQRYYRGKWESAIKYKTYDDKNFKFIFVGDPQIGGGHGRYKDFPKYRSKTTDDDGNRNDAFNWNRVIERAFEFAENPSVLLSAGDQADDMGGYGGVANQESQYSAFLYPKKLKQIVMATSVGNHEALTNGFGRHFYTPNPLKDSSYIKKSGLSYKGMDWYTGYNYFFKYNNVLVVVLETNQNTESDYNKIVRNAIMKYPETDWRIALFHHDIFGAGFSHSQSDARDIRGTIFNVLSKYAFDLVINGHDHVYTSTKFVSYADNNKDVNSPNNYNVDDKVKTNEVIENPKGTFFITANCSSGSKYMYFHNDASLYDNYIYQKAQTNTTSFGLLDFTQNNGKARLTINTYDVESYEVIDGAFIFEKDIGSNVDKCWSEKVRGLPCCPQGTEPVFKENGRLYGYDRRGYCGIVDYQLLSENSCWAKKYGKDCCIFSDTPITNVDERGQWGEEFGEECGIVDNSCWSKRLGYKCCDDPNVKVDYVDDDGKWGVENDDWCGIIETTVSNSVRKSAYKCVAEPLGYQCCSNKNTVSIYTDGNGDWGSENGKWCGLTPFKYELDPINNTTAYEPDPIDPSKLPEIASECWAEKQNELCCIDPKTTEITSTIEGKWGYEDNDWCGIIDVQLIECLDENLSADSQYKCCKNPNIEATYTDSDGTWAVENNDWCIVKQFANKIDEDSDPILCRDEKLSEYNVNDYKCCTEPFPSYYSTEGKIVWGYENDYFCVIEITDLNVSNPSTTTIQPEPNPSTTTVEPEPTKVPMDDPNCWSSKYGYKCCSPGSKVAMSDSKGQWGIEDGDWCGLVENVPNTCWAEKFGYKCCSDNIKKIKSQTDGLWGVEDNHWCGLLIFEENPVTYTIKAVTSTVNDSSKTKSQTETITSSSILTTTTKTSITTKSKTSTTTKTTTSTITTTTTSQTPEPTICAGPNQKCGGIDYTGPTCCPSGYYCKKYSDYYYGCADERYE